MTTPKLPKGYYFHVYRGDYTIGWISGLPYVRDASVTIRKRIAKYFWWTVADVDIPGTSSRHPSNQEIYECMEWAIEKWQMPPQEKPKTPYGSYPPKEL